MPSIQVKDVPEETHAILRRRAAEAHQSLQEYLRSRLIEDASTPTIDEVFATIEKQTGGRAPFSEVVDILRDERDRH